MSSYLPTVFGENLMDVFDDFDRNFFRGFGNIDRALYGKTCAEHDEDRREGNGRRL